MNERFVFQPHTGVEAFLDRLESTPQGRDAVGRIVSEFTSLADLLHHTQPAAGGTSCTVHAPDGTNIGFGNISRGEFAHAAYEVAVANGFHLR